VALWRTVLKLDREPSLKDNFFDLGGDSFASAELIAAVEEKFCCSLPIEAFFERPTIANMDLLLKERAAGSAPAASPSGGERLLRKLQSYTASWKGKRLFKDSLAVGFNTGGRLTPVVWVLQDFTEASQLAKHLGPDQPLYAMRSCVAIVAPKDYSAEIIETVCNRYLWEILALPLGPEFILGGTCQGGILALSLARRLNQIERRPLFLALLEWSYSYGVYGEPTLLVYGEQSYTAELYRRPGGREPDWQRDFSQGMVAAIPGIHGEIAWKDNSVAALATILKERCAAGEIAFPGSIGMR
jgi:acyl carrier protein